MTPRMLSLLVGLALSASLTLATADEAATLTDQQLDVVTGGLDPWEPTVGLDVNYIDVIAGAYLRVNETLHEVNNITIPSSYGRIQPRGINLNY